MLPELEIDRNAVLAFIDYLRSFQDIFKDLPFGDNSSEHFYFDSGAYWLT